ncbi:hypothetical protein EDC96DRAFT_508245 [Choanephora cucurbitarum]|nr:hypothetical protein EDC96DRAFT_508245 [Choanephora cucurbitarum]
MSNNLPTTRSTSTWVYSAVAISLLVLGTGTAYYLVEDDRRVKRRKAGRRAERETARVLNQYKEEAEKIASDMESVESTIEDTHCDDKTFKKKEYTLAQSNELLLQLMEKMDAIRPLTAIIGTEAEPNAFERDLVANIKSKKRTVIEYIEGLFRRLDTANGKAKKEAERREKLAEEKAKLEKEEAERLAKEEAERLAKEEQERIAKEEQERIAREEQVRLAKEEQEKVAQEEALRRKEEEGQRLVQEALVEEMKKEVQKREDANKIDQEEIVIKEEPIEEQASAIEEALTNSEAAAIKESVVSEVAIANEEPVTTVAAVSVDEQSNKDAEKQAIAQEEAILAAMKEAEKEDMQTQ